VKKSKTPTFLLELPLRVDAGQSRRLRAHFEAARCLYNALLGEAMKRLRAMRADPAWQEARSIPQTHKQERREAFSHLRQAYGFSEYALHEFAKEANCSWIADHIDSVMAQTLATRAYQAANRVCLGKAKKVRFKSKGRGLDSVENKRNNTGLRFVLQPPEEGNQGWLIWGKDRLEALIDWNDPIIRRGNTIRTEKLSYRAWQKRYGKSVGRNAPGMFLEQLRRTVASTGGTLSEFPTHSTKLSQYCHGCQTYVKKPLSERWHHCPCGIGPVQRDLYSAWLAAHLTPANTIPSLAQDSWEGADLRLRAAVEVLQQRAKEGQALPRSVGIPRAGARLPESLTPNRLELVYRHGRLEALG